METPYKIKVLIIDDHDMVRQGLVAMLGTFSEFDIVGHTGDGRFALSLCNRYQPDVVLMDLLMPHMDGITATRLIHDKFPEIVVVALTSSVNEQVIREALKYGISSYILKTGSIDEVANAIRNAYIGKPVFSSEAINVLVSTVHHPIPIGHDLSKQERKVLALLIKGLSNRQIGEILVISQSTVKAHVSKILAKLETHSRTRAIAIAIEHEIVSSSEV